MTLSQFIAERAKETYPEPRSVGHDGIIEQVCPMVAAKLQPGDLILDVGCGQGPTLEWFKEHGFTALGITSNEIDFMECVKRGMEVKLLEMHNLKSIYKEHWDCIFARHVLEHSIAPYYVLSEFARILKPGGVLYVEVPSPDTSCNHESNRNHYSVMGIKMWASLIHRAGFGPIDFHELKLSTDAGPDTYFSMLTSKS